jgi:hypothetical protein
MAQIVKLKRTSVQGKVPTISNIELGELAMNTYDGRIFFEKNDGSATVQEILTTNTGRPITGSVTLNGDISATNITLSGNLTVEGTTTTIDSTNLNIGDNIIELNYGGTATTSGIITKDATGGSTTSGSLLWDATNDYWKAGKLGSESEVITLSNLTANLPIGVISGSAQVVSSLSNQSINLGTGAVTASYINANGSGNSILVGDTLRIDENGSGLRMTNVGAFDNSSGDFRIFANQDLILATNGENGTAVTIDQTTKDANFVGAVTASYFVGDGSQLTNVSATISENATVTGSFSNVSSFNVNHAFETKNVIVSVYDTNDSQIIPQSITLTDNNNVQITLSAAQSGFAVVAKGGHIVSGSAGDASNLNGQPASYYLDYSNLNNIPSGIISSSEQIDSDLFDIDGLVSSSAQISNYGVFAELNGDGLISGSSQLSGSTLDAITLNGPVFGSGSDSPYFTEVRYNNSNVMSFNQVYYGNSNGSYFSSGEYQRVVAIVPSGNSNNYQIVGRMTAQNAGETHTVYFNAALRSNTLPALGWTITYHEEYNGGRYINPLLWTKQTTTAGFILAFETLGTIYGNVTVDMDVIPRSTTLLANVTVNTNQSSEQSSVESGYTSNAFTKVRSQQGTTMEVYGPIVPDTNIAYDIGSSSKRFRDIYLDGSTIDLGGTLIQKDDSGDINFKDSATEALKKVVVNELQIGSGATARKIKVDGDGKIKFSDKDDVATGDDLTLPTGVISGSSQITDLTTYKEEVLNYSSYAIKHDLNEQYPIVQAWNTSTSQQEVPTSITSDSVNQVTVVFSTTFAGVIIVKK